MTTMLYFLHGGPGKTTRARVLTRDGGVIFEGDPGLAAVKAACQEHPVVVVCHNQPPGPEWAQASFGRRATLHVVRMPERAP